MENSSEPLNETPLSSSTATAEVKKTCPLCSINCKAIFEQVKNVLLDPKGCWKAIKEDTRSVKQLYIDLFLVLGVIPAVCNFVKFSLIGVAVPFMGTWRMPFFGGLFFHIIQYVEFLALLWVFAFLLEKFAPKFGGAFTFSDAFKLVAYSFMPFFVASVLSVLGTFLGLIGALVGFAYSIYLFCQGISTMATVTEENKTKLITGSLVTILVSGFIIGAIVNKVFMPSYPTPTSIQFDGNKMKINIDQLLKDKLNNH